MRIGIAVSGPLAATGACRVARAWARILATAGHETSLVFESGARALATEGLDTHRYPVVADSRFSRVRDRGRAAARALQALDRQNPLDLVITHDPALTVAVGAGLRQTTVVQTFHSTFVEENHLNNWRYASVPRRLTYPATRALAERIERRALQTVAGVHTLSRDAWDRLSTRYPRLCSRLPWRQIPGTIEERFQAAADPTAVRRSLALPVDRPILLTVRRLIPRNGVDRILTCAQRLRKRFPEAIYVVVGTGALEDDLRRRVADRRLGSVVQMRGFVEDEALPRYYQAADAFLLPTRDLECFGMPVIESMGCGCPPLIARHAGPLELLPDRRFAAEDGSTGAFVSLVARWLEGALPRPPRQALAAETHRRFSESAVCADVLAWVEERGKSGLCAAPAEPLRA